NTDFKDVLFRASPALASLNTLKDDSCLGPITRRQVRKRLGLEHDQPPGNIQGLLSPSRTVQIVIQVRARERHNQRPIREMAVKGRDGRIALTGVQGEEQVERLARVPLDDCDAMAQASQTLRPALGSDPVAGLRLWWCGRNQSDG